MTPRREPRRLFHFTPLRYPGGKAKLAPFVKAVIAENNLEDGTYVEPFAGGAGIALQLLLQGYVSKISINDLSLPIYSFWRTVLREPDRLCDSIMSVPLSVEEWDRQKAILRDGQASPFELGLAAFYLNRTNRSGVLSGGIIGGRSQIGEWLIDARFNREELAYRVSRIGQMSSQIDLSCEDAKDFLRSAADRYDRKTTLIYADPPYYVKGHQLYLNYYTGSDHSDLAYVMLDELASFNWMVSYDNVSQVRELYEGRAMEAYSIPYSVRSAVMGSEVMFYSSNLRVPCDDQGSAIGPADRFAA